jgi:hypothetical protein
MLPSPYSAGDKVFEKDLLQVWQKYSCWDMFASAAGRDTTILGFATDLIQTAMATRPIISGSVENPCCHLE